MADPDVIEQTERDVGDLMLADLVAQGVPADDAARVMLAAALRMLIEIRGRDAVAQILAGAAYGLRESPQVAGHA
jgi:hypothetical protein